MIFFPLFLFFLNFILFIYLEKGEGKEKERARNSKWVAASHASPTADLALNPGMCSDWESNWQPFGSQATLNPLSYTSQGEIFFSHIEAKSCLREVTANTSDKILSPALTVTKIPLTDVSLLRAKDHLQKLSLAN